MKKIFWLLGISTAAMALFSGCASEGAYQPKNTDKYNYEETSPFVLFDAGAQRSVTSPGVQLGKTADGRMKVTAHLRNRENRRIEVQANCVFKDAQGFTVDETPFRTVILDENATQDVTFEAFNANAAKYTIRIRQAR
jgi:uncharacterized protein YcfL